MPERPEPSGQLWSPPRRCRKETLQRPQQSHPLQAHTNELEEGKTLIKLKEKCKGLNTWGRHEKVCRPTAPIPSGGSHSFSPAHLLPLRHVLHTALTLKGQSPRGASLLSQHRLMSPTAILKYRWHLTQLPQKRNRCFSTSGSWKLLTVILQSHFQTFKPQGEDPSCVLQTPKTLQVLPTPLTAALVHALGSEFS